jgi:hypothetical protein
MEPFMKPLRKLFLFPLLGVLVPLVTAASDLGLGRPEASTAAPTLAPSIPDQDRVWEITPLFGFMGGSPLLSVRASMNHPRASLELAFDQAMGRTATLYPITANILWNLTENTRAVPYGTAGGGIFFTRPIHAVGGETLSTLGISFGGGLRYRFNRNVGIRFEAKQYLTRIDHREDARSELIIFQSTSLGVVFAFD